MSIIERKIEEIGVDELDKVDARFGRHAEVDMNAISPRQKPIIEETRKVCFDTFRIRSVYESFPIDRIEDDKVYMRTGYVLESSSLAGAFANSHEIVFMVVSLSGYEEVDAKYKGVLEKYFVDSWATAMVTNASYVVRSRVHRELDDQGLTGTFAWSPGQHNLSMDNQKPLFAMLRPEEIDVTLKDSLLMIPQKSESLFFGISKEKGEADMRPCDFCDLRETCPGAYSDDI